MALRIAEGPPGSGKSFYAVRAIDQALAGGKVVVSNVPLQPGWADRVARGNPVARALPWVRRRKAAGYAGRYLHIASLDELVRVRVDGEGEGRWLVVIDEAQRLLNSRSWNTEGRQGYLDWFSGHRHLGADVIAIAQDVDMLDKQVRVLFEERVTLRNLRNFKVAGVRILPGNFFVAIHRWNSTEKHILKRDTYRLNRRVARLYDTHALSREPDPPDVIRLPRTADQPSPAAGGGEAAAAAAVPAARTASPPRPPVRAPRPPAPSSRR